MDFPVFFFIFVLGLIIGSFLNVVILRYGKKKSFASGNSECPQCHKELKWYELVPVLSYMFQLGRCTGCKKKISIQYPLVELSTGILFVLQYVFFFDPTKAWFPAYAGMTLGWAALCFLVVIFVYDLYHKIIPDSFSFSFGILGLIYLFINFSGYQLLAPFVLFLPFYLLWRISNGTWIGLGDGKLAFGFGGFLGLIYGTSALVLSFWIGAVFAILIMLIQRLRKNGKNITMKSEIPFGPFMIIAFLLVYFLKIDVVGISNLVNIL